MSPTTVLVILAALYLLSTSRRAQGPGPARPGPGTFVSGAEGTAITLPGFGSYRTGPGGTTAIIDPNFLSRIFPSLVAPAPGLQPGFGVGGVGGITGGITGGIPIPSTVPTAVPLPPTAPPGPVWGVPVTPAQQLLPGPADPIAPDNVPTGSFDPVSVPTDFYPPDIGPSPIPLDPCAIDAFWCGGLPSDWGLII